MRLKIKINCLLVFTLSIYLAYSQLLQVLFRKDGLVFDSSLDIFEERNKFKISLANGLSRSIQQRIYNTQNPLDCSEANRKFIVCKTRLECGFGCQIHYLVYCLNEALKQNRTMLIDDSKWKYGRRGFEKYFQLTTKTCRNTSKENATYWAGIEKFPNDIWKIEPDHQANRPSISSYSKYYISDKDRQIIRKFHKNSFLWWNSQAIKYIMRLSPEFENAIALTRQELNMKRPIVGFGRMHIRRSDKSFEADFISTERYMQEAERFFQSYQKDHPNEVYEKLVYVATDDLNVISELQSNYSGYSFKYNHNATKFASSLVNRYLKVAFEGLLVDIQILADCDYVVCTLSSGVCQLILELIQARDPINGLSRLVSLDSDYWFVIGQDQFETAIESHKPPKDRQDKELELEIGDTVQLLFYIPQHLQDPRVQKYRFNGYKNATNLRTNRTGLYPEYKTIE